MTTEQDIIRRRCAEVRHLGTGPISDAMELMELPRAVSTAWTFVAKDQAVAVVGPAYTLRQAAKSRAVAHDENLTRQREASANLAAAGDVGALKIEGASRRVRRDGTIDPSSDTRRYTMWISDDADRVPVLMVAHTDYGDLRMELAAYQPPP